MTFEEWWAMQTANFDPYEIGLMQLAMITWNAAQEIERETCDSIAENQVIDLDLVVRLRSVGGYFDGAALDNVSLKECADEIERLRTDNAALRYSLDVDEELIGMIQRIISTINNRPVPNAKASK